jgi:hypothetical protein
MATPAKTNTERVRDALTPPAGQPKAEHTIDEICVRAFGRADARTRNAVHVALFRLTERGDVVRKPSTYRLK